MFIPTKEAFFEMSATDFEKYSLELLAEQFAGAENLKIEHNVIEKVSDGNYQIDGRIEFTQAGFKFKVLVECKHYKSSISREKVAVLHDKIRALNAQKGILITSSNFQRGAIQYATEHGIALIQLTPVETNLEVRGELNYLMHGESLYNNGKPYIGVLQTCSIGIQCTYLKKQNNSLYEYLTKKE